MFVGIAAADHTPDWRDAFAAADAALPAVVEAHRMAGEADYLLRVVVADMDADDPFYLDLASRVRCRNVTSSRSMERLKATSLLPIDVARA